MVGGADFIKTGEASEKEGLGDAVIGDIIIVCAQVLEMVVKLQSTKCNLDIFTVGCCLPICL